MLDENEKIEMIEKIINERSLDNQLLINLKKEFISKKLNMLNISNLIQRNITFDSLQLNEQIAFIRGSYNYLIWDKLNPSLWFTNDELNNYDGMIDINEDFLLSNIVKFKGFKQINDEQWLGSITVKDLALGLKNGFWSYNFDSQRKPSIIKIGNKDNESYVKLPRVNKESVQEIKKLLKNNEYNFDEIKFNIRLMRGKEPQVKIKYYIDNMNDIPDELQEELSKLCDIDVELNPENDSNNLTLIDSIDGWHRSLATTEAVFEYYAETGEWLEGSFPVSLYMVDVPTARKIVLQGFKRNDNIITRKVKSPITNTEIFLNGLIKKVRRINNKFTDDWMLAEKENLIYRENVGKVIRALKIPIRSIADRNFIIKDLSEILNYILNYFYVSIFNKNEKEFYKKIYAKNNFCIYLIVAWLLKDKEYEDIEKYIKSIYLKQEEICKDNTLHYKNIKPSAFCRNMKNIIKEIGDENDY